MSVTHRRSGRHGAVTRPIAISGAVLALYAGASASAQVLLDPTTLTKYLDPLPNPLSNVISPTTITRGYDVYDVTMSQFSQQLHSQLPATTVWGYNGTYPGPTFDVQRGRMIKVNWINNLVDGSGTPLPHLLPVDTTLHGAGGTPQVRTVVHLHGGAVEPQSDGYPEYWYTANPSAPANGMGGPAGNQVQYTYHNQQPATTLWYHDHAMGATRINVEAGLAGFYLVRDAQEAALNLPRGNFEIPLVLQDRSFYQNGQLFYPRGPGDLTDPGGPNPLAGLPPDFPSSASVVPHFFGDTNLVNGKVWPVLDVEPRKYRFRLLNGSNSRFYDLKLDGAAAGTLPFHQIGSDGGLLAAPTTRSQVLMGPGERSDVIVDFSAFNVGDEVLMRNLGPDSVFEGPGAGHLPADPNTTGQVMKFRLIAPTGLDKSALPTSLTPVPRIPQSEALVTRKLSLVDGVDQYGRPKMTLNGEDWMGDITEKAKLGTTEIWEITNSTTDSHPLHLHLVQFQALDRVHRTDGPIPLEPHELGWKDTIPINRRETVRVIARFDDFAGRYVWHCHLLEHEDHEMMRPFEVAEGPELVVKAGVTLTLNDALAIPSGNITTVDGTLSTAQVSLDGMLRGTGQVVSNVSNRGTVKPGAGSSGTLNVAGNYVQQPAGKLVVGVGAAGSSQLAVSGSAQLAGSLEITLDAAPPAAGQTFDIATHASRTGMFESIERPVLSGDDSISLRYTASNTTAIVTEWAADDADVTGIFDVASGDSLSITGDWNWVGDLVLIGGGDLLLDLTAGSTGAAARLFIYDGTVRLTGSGTLVLRGLDFGTLPSPSLGVNLEGQPLVFGARVVPEPVTLAPVLTLLLGWSTSRARRRRAR